MRVVDDPLRVALGRTPRELVLLAGGVGYCAREVLSDAPSWANLGVYALATVAFAARFFPARALGLGVALGALAQRLPDLRYSTEELHVPHFWAAIGTVLILASPDLEQRFDRAPSRLAWLPNHWTELPTQDARVLRGCGYAVGMLAALVAYERIGPWWYWRSLTEVPYGALLSIAVLAGLLVLLAAGRSVALLLVPVVCAPGGVAAALQIPAAERALAGRSAWVVGPASVARPEDALPLAVFALTATVLALFMVRRTLLVPAPR